MVKGKVKKVLKGIGITIFYAVFLFILFAIYLQTNSAILAGVLILL